MTLDAGARFGSYEITAELGAGGMGVVYRARDTRLKRDVALKVLPQLFALEPDRRARFQREAEVLASLNHPNIAAIHGLEESDGVFALVLEFVDGPTLADRIAQGPIPVDDALPIARQVADALEAAHEQGIIHRDLKPANIKVRSDGTVKVLDFGLAKALGPAETLHASQTMAPTITSPAMTGTGVILGTAAYMAPEQARGKAVDRRADIWAFGCVLFEMLAGRRAFEGDEVTDTLAAVLRAEPDWTALPAETPPHVRALLRWCLHKDSQKRLPHIALARFEIDEATVVNPTRQVVATDTRQPWRFRIAWAAFGIALGALSALIVTTYFGTPVVESQVTRASILSPDGSRWAVATPATRFSLSPDGRQLAFLAADPSGENQRLWVRALEQVAVRPLAGTEGASLAFWSPDSRSLAFSAGGKLRRIDVSGGPVSVLPDMGGIPGTWNREGEILFTPGAQAPIHRISASGGMPTPVATLNADCGDSGHWQPFFLPDGRHFLYHAIGRAAGAVYVGSLEANEPCHLLIEYGSNAQYASGHVLFMRDATLMAQPFDADRLELTGEAVPLVEEVQTGGSTGRDGAFSVSQVGTLVYQTGASLLSQLRWFDRAGREISAFGEPGDYGDLELSPDGTQTAVSLRDTARNTRDLWVFDMARRLRTRFTFDPANEIRAIWSPDGSRIVFASNRRDANDLYEKPSNGVGTEDVLLEAEGNQQTQSWSRDGRYLVYYMGNPTDVWVLPLFGDRKPFPFLQSPFTEVGAKLSPDGRWVSYSSNESGRQEIYISSFPEAGAKWQVSTAGGSFSRWRRDGSELFFLDPDNRLMSAQVTVEGIALKIGAVRPIFQTRANVSGRSSYDVSADGQRFLINTVTEDASEVAISLVVNGTSLLNR